MNQLGVILLAAGASSRMGRPKLLLPWRESTVMGHLLWQWHELGAVQVTVVCRPDDAALGAALDRLNFSKSDRIFNPHAESGMFSSIVCAANWRGWRSELSHWAITLGDQPHLRVETLQALREISERNADAVCQPAFKGHAAHPVILPRPVFERLTTPGVETLKEFLKLGAVRHVQHEIDDPGLLLDLDTPEDYIQAHASTYAA